MKGLLRTRWVLLLMLVVLLAGLLGLVGKRLIVTHAAPAPWNTGDVFAGVGNGMYNVYDNAGNFKETINDGLGGFTTGCAFNNSLDKLYTTNIDSNRVVVYDNADPHPILQSFVTSEGSADRNESLTF